MEDSQIKPKYMSNKSKKLPALKTLKNVKDKYWFSLSKRKGSARYQLNRKDKKHATFTSMASDRSYERSLNTVVYNVADCR